MDTGSRGLSNSYGTPWELVGVRVRLSKVLLKHSFMQREPWLWLI